MKKCIECDRPMKDDECGDEFPEERVCDQCVREEHKMPKITDYDPSTLRFAPIWEEFEDIRHPEDGEPLLGTAVWVQAEAPDGCRFRRWIGIANWKITSDENGPYVVWADSSPSKLSEFAKVLADHLEEIRRPRLNPEVWYFAGACYGSEAYVRLDLECDN